MRALKVLAGAAVIALAGFGGAWLMAPVIRARAPSPAVEQMTPDDALVVEAQMPQVLEFGRTVTAVGTTRPRQSVELRPEADGRVTEIAFTAGQTVEAGAVLLRLDDASERAALKAAVATLAEMEAVRTRQERLLDEGRAALAVYEAAEAAALRAEAERDLAQAELDDRTIRAPFTGIVGLTDLSIGSLVDRTTEVATLDDLSQVEVDFQVPERFLSYLAPGLEVSLTGPAFPDTTFTGRISAIGTRVDAATRSLAVRGIVANTDLRLAAGMFLEVTLVLDRHEALAVPETALGVNGELTFVHVAREGLAQRTQVAAGQSRDGFVEIIEGVGPEDAIITSGLMQVRDGMRVEPRLVQAQLEDVGLDDVGLEVAR